MSNNPKISVCMITYNHERFIGEAIESVLMQKGDFEIELVIGEDFSSDNTRIICERYQKEYPKIIKLLPSEKNWGMQSNFVRTYEQCKGEYIALLEGDDYWTASDKLQQQIAFLDQHPSYSGCFTNNYSICSESKSEKKEKVSPVSELRTTNFIERNHISTLTFVFRKGLINRFPDWFSSISIGDWALYILLSLHGPIKKLDFYSATYRIHPNSSWSSKKQIEKTKKLAELFEHLRKELPEAYTSLLDQKLKSYYHYILNKSLQAGTKRDFDVYLQRYNQIKTVKDIPQYLKIKVKQYLYTTKVRLKKA